MPQKLEVPRFANEAEEAAWWFENQDLVSDELELAEREGRLAQGTAMRRVLAVREALQLEPEDVERARQQAKSRGMEYQAYLKLCSIRLCSWRRRVLSPLCGPPMRRATPAILLLAFLFLNSLQTRASDEDSVRAVVKGEAASWSSFDPKAIASFYTPDATWQNPFGVRLHSSADLEKVLTRLFQRPGYRSQKEVELPKITDIHFPSPNVAVVWAEESSEGQIDDQTGKPMLPRHSHYLEVVVKQTDGWKITECIIMDELQHP